MWFGYKNEGPLDNVTYRKWRRYCLVEQRNLGPNDDYAKLIYLWCHGAGFSIPQDLSILSFDSLPDRVPGNLTSPSLELRKSPSAKPPRFGVEASCGGDRSFVLLHTVSRIRGYTRALDCVAAGPVDPRWTIYGHAGISPLRS